MTITSESGAALELAARVADGIGRGVLPAKIFNDQGIYELEKSKIFSQVWNFLAHESELPKPGDYVLRAIADNSILVARDEDGVVHAHLNMCRHRGNQMCKSDIGNSSHFRCSYHGWVYKNSGELVAVPYHKQAFGDQLDKKEWGLLPVKIETYEGLVFGSLNPDVEPLSDFLGGFQFYLDYYLKPGEGGVEVYGPPDVWESNCNWKLWAENGSGDGYHTPVTHQFGFHLGYFASSGATHSIGHAAHIPGKGHGIGLGETPGLPPFIGYPDDVIAGLDKTLTAGQREAFNQVRTAVGLVFPNLNFLSQPFSRIPGELGVRFTTMRQAQSLGPGRMRLTSWCLLPKDASPEFKEEAYRAYTLAFGPGGMFEQDDMENFNNITNQLNGSAIREVDLPYVMGMDAEPVTDYPGPGKVVKPYMNDSNFRNLWGTWAAYLLGERDGAAQ
ncbi:aromatic ring-hydroxylating oxygenase subunit alpha [Streptomyces sp. ME19-01-6]|uniref:aromatic ring-hydroxylating oxygenase subunit alpha n=1 Tax=Streptomyces sp. ME19-01-6 TaxID=3028686 RepID=UPI0029A8B3BC|nr:Rieske 2Fe-2S domain-containing protein [Streptomyces sp. ME19-01-6]MDX3233913.1 Rieske 2Fe-2S domain-containing protein [Streptomyces sp. ME19-01-6]